MAKDTVISVKNVSKNFVLPHEKISTVKGLFTSMYKKRDKSSESQHALHNINIDIKQGEFFGIVGRNGSGKSTLLKILAGIYQPTTGKVSTYGKLVPFIELGVGFNPELTGRENVYLNGAMLGFSRKEMDAMYDDIVSFAELERFMDQKLKNYSSGMQVRLAFSMATRSEADILLVDEVLAVGDADFQRKCFSYFKELKANKKTVVFVTHDMNAVREYCDRAMLIDKSEVQYIGKPQDIAREYSLLFMDGGEDVEESEEKKNKGRWGNGDIKITKVKTTVEAEDIVVVAEAVVYKAVDKLAYGFHVLGQDDSEITAMNNRMIRVDDLRDLRPGQQITFTWRMLNVFNDGSYYVSLTLVDDLGNTLDWKIHASRFTVKRMDRSTTPVLPPVSVSSTLSKI